VSAMLGHASPETLFSVYARYSRPSPSASSSAFSVAGGNYRAAVRVRSRLNLLRLRSYELGSGAAMGSTSRPPGRGACDALVAAGWTALAAGPWGNSSSTGIVVQPGTARPYRIRSPEIAAEECIMIISRGGGQAELLMVSLSEIFDTWVIGDSGAGARD
jgi:hypothetical protein